MTEMMNANPALFYECAGQCTGIEFNRLGPSDFPLNPVDCRIDSDVFE